ncbi:MAG: PASTA domain-containing protein [Acidimicrobiia bacterium]
MSEDRFKEAFRRITAETPDAPAFSDLETHRAKPAAPIRFKPWMAAVGAAALVLVVVGAFGLLGGGGPDLAAPDEDTIDYIKLEYSSDANLVCQNSEGSDNGGFDTATIEIYGPNSENLTLMVATFPGGSTERMVVEGDPMKPTRAWTTQPRLAGDPDYATGFHRATCDVIEAGLLSSRTSVLDAPYGPPRLPYTHLGIPQDADSWQRGVESGDILETEWNGRRALRLNLESEPTYQVYDIYVAAENPRDLLSYQMEFSTPWGATSSIVIIGSGITQVHESTVDFSTTGPEWTLVGSEPLVLDNHPPPDCPVTIPSQGFTPPDGYPATPSDPDSVWFGKDELWTVLSTDGISEERRSVWWSANFTDPGIESSPDITVTYTLLNSSTGRTIVNDGGTNASTPEDGLFIIAGSEPDIEGCWQVTAIYKNASLSYIYYNPEGQDPPSLTSVVPDVVGMTVDLARLTLNNAGYKAQFHDSDDSGFEICAQEPGAGLEIELGATIGMRTALPGGCFDLMNPNGLYNRVYEDESGRQWYGTDCPAADVLISGGVEAADGLPEAGQTTRDRVEALLQESGAELAPPGTISLQAIPRMGEVWQLAENGDVVVFDWEDDYMIKIVVDETFECPSVPQVWNGIPVAYIKIDTN